MPTVADPARTAPSGVVRAQSARRVSGGRLAAAWLVRQVAQAVLVLWGAVTVTFLALTLVKGDPVLAITGPSQVSPQVRAQIIADYHLDDSALSRYGSYLGHLVRGDLGTSYALRQSVSSAIGQQLLPTVELLVSSVVVAFLVAIVVSLLTANRRRRWLRSASSAIEVVLVSIPTFWFGILLLAVFSFGLKWFPSVGSSGISSLVLPVIAMASAPAAIFTQVLREGLEKVSEEPFVVTARTRGLSESAVLVRHVLRHAILPLVTLSGWIAGALISGAVVVEQVFSRQGLGRLLVNALGARDFPLIIGITLVAALFYVVINIAIDALYQWLDPRLRKATA
ncbi:MAG: ABC transporter permease [Solirubrobacteraceae bacterium]|nr:ABC transporter permease [Patulibacter sp.]